MSADTICRQCKKPDCGHVRNGHERAKTITREHQQLARAHVKRESLQRAGALGFKAAVAKHGHGFAAEVAASWRRSHPSCLELIVQAWLDELMEYYLRDVHLKHGVYPDFQLPTRSAIVEVDGNGWHSNAGPHHEDREQRDSLRNQIMAHEGYRVLHLCEKCVRDGSGKQLMVSFLEANR